MKLHELQELTATIRTLESISDQEKLNTRLRQLGMDPGNFYQELEMSSRFVDTHRDISYSNANLSLHSHSFCEVLYCRNTCGVEYLVGSHRYRLQKGDIVFVPPGISHRPILPEKMPEPYKRDVLWISTEFMEHMAALFPDPTADQRDHSTPIRTAGTRWEFLGDLFRAGVREAEAKEAGWEIAVMGNALTIFANLKRAYIQRSAKPMKEEKPELLDQLTAYIEAHFSSPIALSSLADHFYVSSSTVSHLFKQKLGVSFYRYVTQRRLIAAKTLIEKGLPLEEVGLQAGFADYSTFFRAFKQEYGISPRQYRKIQALSSAQGTEIPIFPKKSAFCENLD